MRTQRAGCARHAGFSLLETVVALVIFAAAGTALFTLFNTNLIALARVEAVSAHAPVVRAALTTLSAINPAEQQEGRFAIDGRGVTWTATLVEPMRPVPGPAGMTRYQLGLYEIALRIGDGVRPGATWRVRQVGYRDMLRPSSSPGAGQ